MNTVVKVLEDPELKAPSRAPERRAALRRVAAELFDYGEMARRALNPHWAGRTAAERDELLLLFRELLERSYLSKLEEYTGERMLFDGETVNGSAATVRTRIVTRFGSEVPVDYRLLRRRDRWRAYDVVVEGVSLVGNYRGQFAKIMKAGSHQELVRRLRGKLEEPLLHHRNSHHEGH
jgi:phospholipid transport system substrate-binding protein